MRNKGEADKCRPGQLLSFDGFKEQRKRYYGKLREGEFQAGEAILQADCRKDCRQLHTTVGGIAIKNNNILLTAKGWYYWVVMMRTFFSEVGDYKERRIKADD